MKITRYDLFTIGALLIGFSLMIAACFMETRLTAMCLLMPGMLIFGSTCFLAHMGKESPR